MLALDRQENLLHRIGRAEYLIRKIRDDNKSIKRALTQPDTSRDAARKAKARHLAGSDRIEHQKALIAVLRSIGDSIAFIYGDRWDLKQMVQKEDSGFITGKNGTRLERGILRKAFEMGATVILNDLTHTLRHGDITVFRPDLWPESESPFLLIEVKSGRGGDRTSASRQIAATEQIFSYLETDKREANGGLWQRVSVNEHPKYHFEEVTRMMTDLPKGGWLLEEVEPGLHYALIDCAREVKAYDLIFGDLFSRGRAFLMSVNDMKKHQLAYYPFPLCIHNPETLFRFYNGDFVMFVIVDLNCVNEAMAKYSMKVAPSGNDEYPWKVSSTARGTRCPKAAISIWDFIPLAVWPQNSSAWIGCWKTWWRDQSRRPSINTYARSCRTGHSQKATPIILGGYLGGEDEQDLEFKGELIQKNLQAHG